MTVTTKILMDSFLICYEFGEMVIWEIDRFWWINFQLIVFSELTQSQLINAETKVMKLESHGKGQNCEIEMPKKKGS